MLAWTITWVSVILLDMVDGILVGISASILALVIRTRKADCMVLTRLGKTEHYDNADIFNKDCHEFEGIKIIRFLAPLNFINRERFRHVLLNLSGYDPFNDQEFNISSYNEPNKFFKNRVILHFTRVLKSVEMMKFLVFPLLAPC